MRGLLLADRECSTLMATGEALPLEHVALKLHCRGRTSSRVRCLDIAAMSGEVDARQGGRLQRRKGHRAGEGELQPATSATVLTPTMQSNACARRLREMKMEMETMIGL